MIDKKPDDRSSAELAQQQSQQLCVLDTKPSGTDNKSVEESNQYDSIVPEIDEPEHEKVKSVNFGCYWKV